MSGLLIERRFRPVKVLCLYQYWVTGSRFARPESVMIEVYSSREILDKFNDKMHALINEWRKRKRAEIPAIFELTSYFPENELEFF